MTAFLGLDFRPLTFDDQEPIEALLHRDPQRLADYTFAMLISWNPLFSYEWVCLEDQTLLISAVLARDGRRHLLQPEGKFGKVLQQHLVAQIRLLDYPIKIVAVTDPFLVKYPEFVTHFVVNEERGQDNYIYAASDLAHLKGRRFSKKRNLIAQAEATYNWSVHPLEVPADAQGIEQLARIGDLDGEKLPQSLQDEHEALLEMLTHYARLDQHGVLIRIDGKPAAFSIYEPLLPDMAVIHFEKAERQYKGLYQLINRETAKVIMNQGFQWINREEDMDLEGLRQTKLSYFPKELIRYNVLRFVNVPASETRTR
jgi:hypothetical protein